MPDRPPPSPSPPPAAMPTRVHGIVRRLSGELSSELRRELDRLLVTVELEISREAERSRDATARAQRLAAVRALQVNALRFVQTFLREQEQALFAIRDPRPATEVLPPTTRLEGLRLVDDTQLDEDAELATIAERLERRSRLPLLLLGQRFGVLAGAPAYTANDLPVGPGRVMEFLTAAAEVLDTDRETRVALYRAFERQFGPAYDAMVESMNELLSREHVLPGLTYVPLRRLPRPVATPAARDGSDDAASGRSGAGAGAAGKTATIDRGYTGWAGGPVDGDQETVPDTSTAETVALLKRMLAGREQPAPTAETLQREAPPVALSAGEVDASLAALQARSAGTAAPPGVAAIRQALLAQSRLQRGHAAALSPEDNETFELADMFQREVRRQLRPETPSRAMVDRLQIPLLRVALRDPELFVDPRHPARRLLNAVAESGARWLGAEEIDTGLLAQLQQAVDHVAARYGEDPEVFANVARPLQQHFARLAQRAQVSERRQIEASRGREKLVLARRQAQAVVAAAIDGHAPPRFLRNLLEHAWVDVLTLTLLRHGVEAQEWTDRVADTRRLAVIDGPLDPGLGERITRALAMVGHHPHEASSIVDALAGGGETSGLSRTELALKMRTRARLGEDSASAGKTAARPLTPGEQAWHERLLALPAGTWIEFDAAAPDTIVRRRLAWTSQRTGDVLFVNNRGQRIADGVPADLDGLARRFAEGRARVVPAEHGRLVDSAWHAALAAMRGQDHGAEDMR